MIMMGVRWFFSVVYLSRWCLSLCIVFCSIFIPTTLAQKGFTACDICNCTSKISPWKIINCNLEDDKVLRFDQRNIIIPANVTEIYIFGGGEVNFAHKTFNILPSLELIHIDNTKRIILEKKSFIDITAPSLLIQIRNCDELTIRSGAFDSIQGAVSTEIENAKHIIIEPSSFSKLTHSIFRNVGYLELKERAFDITNQIISTHGAVTEIVFDNVNITELPHETFYKALASVRIINSNIGIIHTEAFKATEISSVTFHNTNIDQIYERPFKDGTLIAQLEISKCNISKLHPRSIMVALTNFTLNHSIIRDIKSRAIDLTVAKVLVSDNQINNIESMGFIFNQSNKITVDDNIIERVEANFIKTYSSDITTKFSFKGNELHRVHENALSFINEIDHNHMLLNDNSFWQLCNCDIEDWVQLIINGSDDIKVKLFMDTSYCTIDHFLGQCFTLKPGIINMRNFSNNNCQNFTECKVIEATVNEIDTKNNRTFLPIDNTTKQNWLIFIIAIVGIFILGIVITFIVLLVRGSRWLKEKGYFRNNMHYNNNDLSTEEEGTIVTVDEMEKLEIPDELTVEFLQMLAERLDDPSTNQEATEMVVRLYEMFIVDDSYENNNRQDEEAHLYEELGNLNLQIPPPPYEEQQQQQPQQLLQENAGSTQSIAMSTTEPRSILRMMEEKFHQDLLPIINSNNTKTITTAATSTSLSSPALVSEYSEPTDAAVHLYSELKGKSHIKDNNNALEKCATKMNMNGGGSLRSCNNNNSFNRPLPSKPNSKTLLLDEAGPSSSSKL